MVTVINTQFHYFSMVYDKNGKVYSLKYTDILKVFFTPHNVDHCCTNVIQNHCWETVCSNNPYSITSLM